MLMEKSNFIFLLLLFILFIFRYVGDFKDGLRDGKGVLSFPSGNK